MSRKRSLLPSMAPRIFLVLLGLVAGVTAAVGLAQAQSSEGFDFRRECDAVAGHPDDVRTYSPTGVLWDDLKPNDALVLCMTAHRSFPDHGQTMVNLSRVYNKMENYKDSLRLAERATQTNHPFAYYWLAIHYTFGDGVPKDHAKAHSLYKKSADLGNAEAMRGVSLDLRRGRGVEVDVAGAIEYAKKAIQNGSTKAHFDLGLAYEKAANTWTKNCAMWPAVQQTLALAQENLKLAAGAGLPAQKDLDRVSKEYEKITQFADVWNFHASGQSAMIDNQIDAFRNMAANGHEGAQCTLANHYLDKKDWAKLAVWAPIAASNGHADMKIVLGDMYRSGLGVTQSDAKAIEWLTEAYNQLGDLPQAGAVQAKINSIRSNPAVVTENEAQNLYDEGMTSFSKKRYTAAFESFRQAGERGHPASQYMMGVMYQQGLGVFKNPSEAAFWFESAAESGHKEAQQALQDLN